MYITNEKPMTDTTIFVLNFVMALSATIIAYAGLPAEPMLILLILIMFDTIFGSAKVLLIEPKNYSSHKLARGVVGKMGLLFVPYTIGLMGKALGQEMDMFVMSCLYWIILSQGYSVIANIYMITSGKEVPEWDAISMILRGIINFADRVVGKK